MPPRRNLSTTHFRDVKRLYLSGEPIATWHQVPGTRLTYSLCEGNVLTDHWLAPEPCYQLVYLELASCRLTSVPPALSSRAPNLRALNMNYNFVEDITSLGSFSQLRKFSMIGSRLRSAPHLVRALKRLPDVEQLDFR